MLHDDFELGFLLLACTSLAISIAYAMEVDRADRELPRIPAGGRTQSGRDLVEQPIKISVIVPAFNEAENIEDCVRAILENNPLPASQLQLVVVDDQSTDATFDILKRLEQSLADPRLHLLSGSPRPQEQVWTGKNWACHQGAQWVDGDYLLFLDADVRLKPGAIAAALQTAIAYQTDLLTCIPSIVSSSLVEWLVQPLILTNAMVAFNSAVVKDPKTPTTYALGPFLLFRASSYRQIGEHAAIAAAVAEDVALARRLKRDGFKVQHFLGSNLASLRMYRNWKTLWEGWTKVLYVGAGCNPWLMVLMAVVMLSVYTIPWVGLLLALLSLKTGPGVPGGLMLLVALVGIAVQYATRSIGCRAIGTTHRYWWLGAISGILVSLLGLASVIKTETGWGWTWRGRPLKLDRQQSF